MDKLLHSVASVVSNRRLAKLANIIFQPLVTLRTTFRAVPFLCLCVYVMGAFPDYFLLDVETLLINDLKLSSTKAAAVVNTQDGCRSIFGIIGAILVDVYLTDYGMIFFSSLIYSAGLFLLSGAWYHLNNYHNISIAKWIVGSGLFLIAVAKCSLMNSALRLAEEGGKVGRISLKIGQYSILIIIVVASTTGDDESEMDESLEAPKRFFFSAISVLLVCVVALIYLRTEYFVTPIGDRGTTPLKNVARVWMAAIMRIHLHYPQSSHQLYEETPVYPLTHTTGFRFLDKAATKETTQPEEERKKWLCTITEVEETKRLLRMAPMCITFLAYGMIQSVGNTFFLAQGNLMKPKNANLQDFLVLAQITSSVAALLYKVLISNKLKGAGQKYDPAIEYSMGMVLSSLCCTIASWVATEIFGRSVERKSRVHVLWLIPQFVTFGAMDGLAGGGIEGFFYGQLPRSMERYGSVFAEAMVGAGTLFAIILVLVTNAATNWLSDDKNQANYRLDKFYHLCTVVANVTFFGYCFVAVRYNYQDQSQIGMVENEHPGEHMIDINTNSQQPETDGNSSDQVPDADSIHTNETQIDGHATEQIPDADLPPPGLAQKLPLPFRLKMYVNRWTKNLKTQ